MINAVKAIGGPGSIGFLAVCLAMALALGRIGPRCHRLSRGWILLLLLGYLLLGLPLVANQIAREVSDYRPLDNTALLASANTLIVLDGDNSVARVREAQRLFAAMPAPIVIVSGRQRFVDAIIGAGIPSGRIHRDFRSRTTREQIANVKRWLHRRDNGQVAIVASRLQMRRVSALLQTAGLQPVLAPSAIDTEPPTAGPWVLVPTYVALRVSRDALYEYLALTYYRHQGWIQ
jgi:uncharacterized SAM-binding protein YcdF (DUF218 family)